MFQTTNQLVCSGKIIYENRTVLETAALFYVVHLMAMDSEDTILCLVVFVLTQPKKY